MSEPIMRMDRASFLKGSPKVQHSELPWISSDGGVPDVNTHDH